MFCTSCGSIFGSFSEVSAAKVSIPENNDETKYYAAYSAYAELLSEEKVHIDSYTDMWGNESVVLADVYGDDTPELIYVKSPNDGKLGNGYAYYTSTLEICTYQNGSPAMSCDEAILYLWSKLGETDSKDQIKEIGWIFLGLGAVSAVSLLISIVLIIKKAKSKNSPT